MYEAGFTGGVRVVRAGSRPDGGGDATGRSRPSAIDAFSVGASRIWMGRISARPGTDSGPHHHGDNETAAYLVRGRVRFSFGPGYRNHVDLEPGDFVFVPANTPHIEANLSEDEPAELIVARGPENVVVALEPGHDGTMPAGAIAGSGAAAGAIAGTAVAAGQFADPRAGAPAAPLDAPRPAQLPRTAGAGAFAAGATRPWTAADEPGHVAELDGDTPHPRREHRGTAIPGVALAFLTLAFIAAILFLAPSILNRGQTPVGAPTGAASSPTDAAAVTPVPTDAATPPVTATPTLAPTPTEVVSPTPTAPPTPRAYTVAKNDTFCGLVRRFKLTSAQLLAFNPGITDPNRIALGSTLVIPLPGATAPPGPTPAHAPPTC